MPSTPDEFLAALWLLIVLGAFSLVMLGRLVVWIAHWPVWDRWLDRPDPAPDPPPVPPDDYVTSDDALFAHDAPFSRFEPPEPPQNVQPVQLVQGAELSGVDIIRLDTVARLMAAGLVSESSAITSVWDGRDGVPLVKRGGSKAYLDRRDALRALATRYGWKAPEPAPEQRQVAINGGRDGYVSL